MTSDYRSTEAFKSAVNSVAVAFDADIITCSANMFPPADTQLVDLLQKRKRKKKNLVLVMTTPGGLTDVAYRMGRSIQLHYKTKSDSVDRGKFLLFVPRYCKSAGTVLALAADGLIMSEMAELGPIDAQLRKEDEIGDWTSGLTAIEALATLQEKASSLFIRQFKALRFGADTRFSTKMATDLAARLSVGLLEPIYSQIDPMRLGEIERIVRIAVEYGDRLATENVTDGTVARLVVGYPSHGFIIDREETRELFQRVDEPSPELELIGKFAWSEARKAGVVSDERAKPVLRFENTEDTDGKSTSPREVAGNGKRTHRSRATKAGRQNVSAAKGVAASPVAARNRNGRTPSEAAKGN